MSARGDDFQDLRQASQDAVISGLPDLLLPYQQRANQTIAGHDVVYVEKSRRIGLTWGVAAHAVLTAATARASGGMDVLYISYSQDMTRDFIDACGMWARAFNALAFDVEEGFLEDPDHPDKSIKTFRISFASGFEIVALSSAPRSLRGKQGLTIIDEAAFVDHLDELLKAALALLMWGGKVVVISTHNGVEHPFARRIEEIRAGKTPAALLRITLADALQDGLYQRICLVRGQQWSPEAQAAWEQALRKQYGEAADEELDCVPAKSGGVYLPSALREARADRDIPVFRWAAPGMKDGRLFVDWPADQREAEISDGILAPLAPVLSGLSGEDPHSWGVDFGRLRDRTVIWVLATRKDLCRATVLVVELSDCPFAQQRQVLSHIVARLPRWNCGSLDAGGNGQELAEFARQTWGRDKIGEIKLSQDWYAANMPPFKSAMEGSSVTIPADRDIIDDFGKIRMVGGIPKIVTPTVKGSDGKGRHGDAAIAAVLAYAASRTDGQEAAGETVEKDPVEKEAQETTPGGVRRLLKRPGFTRLFGGW